MNISVPSLNKLEANVTTTQIETEEKAEELSSKIFQHFTKTLEENKEQQLENYTFEISIVDKDNPNITYIRNYGQETIIKE